ncbi:MAG: HAD family phosphatase [Prevotella sp.]|nr:HAD family phosphatase [Prevotella sp.]
MIKNVIFDLGGVVMTLSPEVAERRFVELGLVDAPAMMDRYTQQGIFGELEEGKITPEEFIAELERHVGRQLSFGEVQHCWLGYCKEVPQRNLRFLEQLRQAGYRLILLSNTNPFMMAWAKSAAFSGDGKPITHYFDACYLSFEMKVMKPAPEFFSRVLMSEQVPPSECLFIDDGPRNVASASQMGMMTLCPENGDDWTGRVLSILQNNNEE